MSVKAFTPKIDQGTNLQTCVQVATVAASAVTPILGDNMLIKCLTDIAYIRLTTVNGSVSATNGYYMAVGDEVRWQKIKGASHIAFIRGSGDGALSIAFGNSD
ncbi:MAG: hypothetical protein GY861_14720 [bacterium]|nr:hypothetical protein [bacterium]